MKDSLNVNLAQTNSSLREKMEGEGGGNEDKVVGMGEG